MAISTDPQIGRTGISVGTGWADRPLNLVRTGPKDRAPVILIHAVGIDLGYWDRQIETLCGHHDVVAFDLPGHGRTPGVPGDWTLREASACLADVVRRVGGGPVHLVGLSVGGMIAQAFTLAQPGHVYSLTLVDTAAAFEETARVAMRDRAATVRTGGMQAVLDTTIERWFTPETERRRPDLIDRVTKTLLAGDPLIHAALWEMIAELDLVAKLHRIACPTLIMVGERDPSSPPEAARILQAGIHGAELHVIADASHMAILEQPDAVSRHPGEFLERLGSTSAGVGA